MHINQSQRPWVQGVGAAFALLAAFHTHAQGISNAAAQAASAEQQFNFSYRSVLTGYQPHADSKIESWAKANQTVQELGGWKAYAKEPAAASVEQKNPAPHNHSMPMGHPHGGHK
jgi:hypothetical protein